MGRAGRVPRRRATGASSALITLEVPFHLPVYTERQGRITQNLLVRLVERVFHAELEPQVPGNGIAAKQADCREILDTLPRFDPVRHHPYPWMVREFHRVIGDEAAAQCRERFGPDHPTGRPDVVVACVGGGSNAAGIFSGFAEHDDVELIGVEPAGGAAVGHGVPGIVHGMKSYLMQDEFGQVLEAHSISAGLDYPGVGPEHAHLAAMQRASYEPVTDAEVIDAFKLLSRTEGIIPALESAHAVAWVSRERDRLKGRTVVVNLSGRGDKDVAQMMEILGGEL